MARERTLGDMRSDLRIAADIVNRVTRHPNSQLNRYINESIQRLREIVSDNGHPHYLITFEGTVGTANRFITATTDHLRTYGVDIDDSGESWSLEEFTFRERNDYGGSLNSSPEKGPPEFYMLSFNVTPYVNVNILLLMPVPDKTYTYRHWYLGVWDDLTNDADLFDGVAGWEDWVKWDCCCKVAVRDKNSELYNFAAAERGKAEAFIVKTAPKRARLAAGKRLDTRNQRRLNELRARRPGGWL